MGDSTPNNRQVTSKDPIHPKVRAIPRPINNMGHHQGHIILEDFSLNRVILNNKAVTDTHQAPILNSLKEVIINLNNPLLSRIITRGKVLPKVAPKLVAVVWRVIACATPFATCCVACVICSLRPHYGQCVSSSFLLSGLRTNFGHANNTSDVCFH